MMLSNWNLYITCLIILPWKASTCPFFQHGQNASSFEMPNPHKKSEENITGSLRGRNLQHNSNCNSPFSYGKFDLDLPALNIDYQTLVRLSKIREDYMEDHPRICARGGNGARNGQPCHSGNFLNMDSAAGYTFFGQLVSHDMNNAKTAVLGVNVAPENICNANTPLLDLDTIYDFLGRPAALRVHKGLFKLNGRDYERTSNGEAKIPDGRNDEHVILSQLTVAFMRLHNLYVGDFVRGAGSVVDPNDAFQFGRRHTVRAYQSMIIDELLPALCDRDMLRLVRNPSNRVLYVGSVRQNNQMPIEFSDAAWRVIHSRTRSRYDLNPNVRDVNFFDLGGDSRTLLGGRPLTAAMEIQWNVFFGPNAQQGRILDMCYSAPLNRMPTSGPLLPAEKSLIRCSGQGCPIDPSDNNDDFGGDTVSLSMLDLVRSKDHGLYGGIAMARAVRKLEDDNNIGQARDRVQVLSMADMRNDRIFGLPDFYNEDDVPLLLYMFYESILQNNGQVCGKLCTRVIGEVILANIEDSPFSILSNDFNGQFQRFGGGPVTVMDMMNEIGFA